MSVESNTVEFSYVGDGVTTVFPFPSKFLAMGDLIVGIDGDLVGGYNVTGAGNPSGGNVIFTVAPAVSARVLLLRKPPISQLVDFVNGQTIYEDTLDTALDKLTMICQYLARQLQRTARTSELDITPLDDELVFPSRDERRGKLLGFDSTPEARMQAILAVGGPGPITSTQIVDSSVEGRAVLTGNAAAGRTALGAGAKGALVFQAADINAAMAALANEANISGDLAITTAHNGAHIDFYGTAFAATPRVNFGTATGYAVGHKNRIANRTSSTTHCGLIVTVPGYPDAICWPGRHIDVRRVGNVWWRSTPERMVPQGVNPLVFHVNPATGNDANDGLNSGRPLATIGQYLNLCRDQIDLRGAQVIGRFNDGFVCTEHVIWDNPGPLGRNQVYIEGNGNWVINSPGACLQTRDNGIVTIRARDAATGTLRLASSVPGCYGLYCTQQSVIDTEDGIEFGNFASGTSFGIDDASANIRGSMRLTGGADAFINMIGGRLNWAGAPVNVFAPLAFSDFLRVGYNAVASLAGGIAFSGAGAGTNTTCRQFYAYEGGRIAGVSSYRIGGAGPNYLPGTIAGAADAASFGSYN